MDATIVTLNKEKYKIPHSDGARRKSLASLFFGDAPRIRKLTRNAGVNTQNDLSLGCCLSNGWGVHICTVISLRTLGRLLHSTKLFISVPCLMCCAYSHARMASSTSLCLGFAVPIIFHESPMVAFILCWLLTILFLSLHLSV